MQGQQVHPRHVRIGHWVNAFVVSIMLWSGFSMLVADRQFANYVHLIPNAILSALQLTGHRLAGRAWHLGMAILFMANALFYAATSLASGAWRRLVPRGAWLRGDYNAAQRLAYSLVMAGGGVMIFSGLALWFGKRFPWMLAVLGGERVALWIHVVVAFGLLGFVAIHLVQVARAGLPTLIAMMTGSPVQQPAHTRRTLAWGAGIVATAFVAFIALNHTGGRSGVPVFLHWAVHSRAAPGAHVDRSF